MEISEELKMRLFRVFNRMETLKKFEEWLYMQMDLTERLNEDFYLDLFCFNYNQLDAPAIFTSHFLGYFCNEEYERWQIKENLRCLSLGSGDRNYMLECFYFMGLNKYPFLWEIGQYKNLFDEIELITITEEELAVKLMLQSEKLLLLIEQELKASPDLNLKGIFLEYVY